MDFSYSETQSDLKSLASDILERATPARVGEMEASDDGIDRELWAEFARADLLGVPLPEDVGGSGHGISELCVLLEEVGRHVAPLPCSRRSRSARCRSHGSARPNNGSYSSSPCSKGRRC